MKAFVYFLLVFSLLFLAFGLPCYAKSGQDLPFVSEFFDITDFGENLNEENLISSIGPDFLISEIFSSLSGEGSKIGAFFLLLLGVGLSILLADFLVSEGTALASTVRSGVSCLSALLLFGALRDTVFAVGESLEKISSLFEALIPIVSGISLASGEVTGAAVESLNMNLTFILVGKIGAGFLLPLVFVSFAFSLISGISEGAPEIAKGLRSLFLWCLGILSTLLLASLSMQRVLASAKDGSALRAARYAIQGMIPVVGSTVSGALASISGALAEARAIVGVGAVSLIFITAASPLIVMLSYRFVLSLAITFFEFLGSFSCKLFSAFRASLDSLIAVYVISALVYIIEIVIFLKGGVEIFV